MAEEVEAIFFGLLDTLDLRWLDEPMTIWRTERKLHQLAAAVRAEVRIPSTIITNDPRQAREFSRTAPVLAKPVGPGTIGSSADREVFFPTALPNNLIDALERCPVLLQHKVDSVADVRVVTVAARAFPARRKRRPEEPIDWRESDPEGSGFVAWRDRELEQAALRVAAALGLRLTAQDWAISSDGFWFLEANPAGQWLFLPEPLADSITRAIAEAILAV